MSLAEAPRGRAYRLSFRLLLQNERSDFGVVLPVGQRTTSAILNLERSSGLGLKETRWDQNPTSTRQSLKIAEPIEVVIKVGPYGSRAVLFVEADQKPFIRWEGDQADLSIANEPTEAWAFPDPDHLGFTTYAGGVEISEVKVEYQVR